MFSVTILLCRFLIGIRQYGVQRGNNTEFRWDGKSNSRVLNSDTYWFCYNRLEMREFTKDGFILRIKIKLKKKLHHREAFFYIT